MPFNGGKIVVLTIYPSLNEIYGALLGAVHTKIEGG